MLALGCLAFYAIQWAAQAGWSPVLFRVMEAITAYLVPGGIIMFVLLALSGLHINHLFVWADPEVVAHDKLLQGKAGWLNGTGMLIRAAIFLGGWMLYRHFAVKFSRNSDVATDNRWFKKSFKISAGFLVFFIYTESMMSWDWIMSVDPHWFSTLFGWYVFAGMMVCAITVIAMITIYLKSKGHLDFVNDSHIHDLAKFMHPRGTFESSSGGEGRRIAKVRHRHCDEGLGLHWSAAVERCSGGCDPAASRVLPIGREFGGPAEERNARRVSAALIRTHRASFENQGHLLVTPDRRGREVPGATVGMTRGADRRCERPVDGASVRWPGVAVDRRTNQRMPERDLGVEHQKVLGFGGLGRCRGQPDEGCGPPQQGRIAGGIRCAQQEHHLCLDRECSHLLDEALFELATHR
jgi:hypothetical protein